MKDIEKIRRLEHHEWDCQGLRMSSCSKIDMELFCCSLFRASAHMKPKHVIRDPSSLSPISSSSSSSSSNSSSSSSIPLPSSSEELCHPPWPMPTFPRATAWSGKATGIYRFEGEEIWRLQVWNECIHQGRMSRGDSFFNGLPNDEASETLWYDTMIPFYKWWSIQQPCKSKKTSKEAMIEYIDDIDAICAMESDEYKSHHHPIFMYVLSVYSCSNSHFIHLFLLLACLGL